MEGAGDSVRVMTVHAAKGLEAPIVFLPDACSAPYARNDAKLIDLGGGEAGEPPLLRLGDEERRGFAAARERAPAGARGRRGRTSPPALCRDDARRPASRRRRIRRRDEHVPADNWYDLVRSGLGDALRPAPAPWDGGETIWRLGERLGGEAVAATPAARAAPAERRRGCSPQRPRGGGGAAQLPRAPALPAARAKRAGRAVRRASSLTPCCNICRKFPPSGAGRPPSAFWRCGAAR